MHRVDGFLDLKDYTKDADSYYRDFIQIKDKKYFCKTTNNPYHELICSEIANMLGVNCVQYDLGLFKGYKGVISECYRKDDATYISGYEVLEKFYTEKKEFVNEMGLANFDWRENWEGPYYIHMNNLEIIWPSLFYLYCKYPEAQLQKCVNDLVLQFILMILTGQYDRGAYQWELEITEEAISVVPMFDNEASFHLVNASTGMSTSFADCEQSPSVVLKEFLTISSSEYVDLFLEKFNLLTEDAFIKIIHAVEHKIMAAIPLDVCDNLLTNFKINRTNIEKVLKELNINNGRR